MFTRFISAERSFYRHRTGGKLNFTLSQNDEEEFLAFFRNSLGLVENKIYPRKSYTDEWGNSHTPYRASFRGYNDHEKIIKFVEESGRLYGQKAEDFAKWKEEHYKREKTRRASKNRTKKDSSDSR